MSDVSNGVRVLLFRVARTKKLGREMSGLLGVYENCTQSSDLEMLKQHVAEVYGEGIYRSVLHKQIEGRWVYAGDFGEFSLTG